MSVRDTVTRGEGPVVGRFGGPLMLPADVPDPWYPLLATLDCAARPEEVRGLPLPADVSLPYTSRPRPGSPAGRTFRSPGIPEPGN
ncbi:hypothetical protein ACFY6U_38315 [Streptomyces sp. NPDC013157]|uniref:hypothetical protein n=1 Tax=Streptomyces sp. NPDC013157 TaxID=3364861 RepID=UPI00368BF775